MFHGKTALSRRDFCLLNRRNHRALPFVWENVAQSRTRGLHPTKTTNIPMKTIRSAVALVAVAGFLGLSLPLAAQTNSTPAATNASPRHPRRGMMSVDSQMKRLTERLQLTTDQQPKVKAALEEHRKAIDSLWADTSISRSDRRSQAQVIQEKFTQQLKSILTPEQFTKFDSQVRSRRNRTSQDK